MFARGAFSVLVVLTLATTLVLYGCAGKAEPPFDFGTTASGPIRSTHLEELEESGKAVYRVDYPAYDLTSLAYVRLATGTMEREVFPGKWVVDYEYKDARAALLQLPDRIIIHTARGSEEGSRVNTYHLVGMEGNGVARYEGKGGRKRLIHVSYFEIAPSSMGMPMPFGRY